MDSIKSKDVNENKVEIGSRKFPFQAFTQIVPNKNCPIQKYLKKLDIHDFKSYSEKLKRLELSLVRKTKLHEDDTKLNSDIDFLKRNKAYIREINRTYLDGKTYNYFIKKNVSFLHSNRNLEHLKNLKRLGHPTTVFFLPNEMHTDLSPYYKNLRKVKSSSGKQVMSLLRFIFVDIDGAESWNAVQIKIKSFGLDPDVIVQTSEKGFHLYWSIQPVSLSVETEDRNGAQLDLNLIQYEEVLKKLVEVFGADKKRTNASSKMRMPNTINLKPHKNQNFKTRYLSEKTLEVAHANPNYDLNSFTEYLSNKIGFDIGASAKSLYTCRLRKSPTDETGETLLPEQVAREVETAEEKVKFDFEYGWLEALEKLTKFYNLKSDYFSENDLIVLKHIWQFRFCEIINFPKSIRIKLKGRGNKYSELKMSVDKIACLPKKIRRYKTMLIKKVESHRLSSRNQEGRLAGYKIDSMFLESCGIREKTGLLEKISNDLYIKSKRNEGIYKDCYILKKYLKKSKSETRDFIVDKIVRSSIQPDINLRCTHDISNVDAWLRIYYKNYESITDENEI